MNSVTSPSLDFESRFSRRIKGVRTSFIREILKVTENPEIISFAGGLPSPELFPVNEITEMAAKIMKENGRAALQYSTTEGYLPLREWICARYKARYNLVLSPEEILITTGSQQGLDLLGKVFVNPGDRVLIERPGYLGAIQSFSLYEPSFVGVDSSIQGINTSALADALGKGPSKLLYTVPNFQNPSGATYTQKTREEVALLSGKHGLVTVEDDPYGELRYRGSFLPPIRALLPSAIMLGSFSKIVAPGMRLGWVAAPNAVIRRLVTAKQAADLHTDIFAQRLLHAYLASANLDQHIEKIRTVYGSRCAAMAGAFRKFMPSTAACNEPDGGMFLWATLPGNVTARALFDAAIRSGVAFVPGDAFYVDDGGRNTMRLNFTNTNEPRIEEGMRRLAAVTALAT